MLASSNISRLLQTFVCIAFAMVVCVGCGKPKVQPASETPAESTSTEVSSIRFQSAEHAQQTLAGLWIGRAVLNKTTLQNLVAQMPEPQQQALLKEAQTFASTQMALLLTANGNMQTAVVVTPAGAQPMEGQTNSNWSIARIQKNQVIVESTPQTENGESKTTQTVFTVSADGNRIVMQANVVSELAQCEPLIYLDRQIDERVAETPNDNNTIR